MSSKFRQPPPDALSYTNCGESFSGIGCFPIGASITHNEAAEIVFTLRHLRESKLLHPLPFHTLQEFRSRLQPLQMAQAFWSHPRDAREAEAIHELFDSIFPTAAHDPNQLQVFVFPDSTLLSSARTEVWGLFELDVHSRTTILYVSERQRDPFGTILHTFMASRMCSRLQCFLAEYVLADQARTLTGEWELPERFQWDIDMLSREDTRMLVSRMDSESTLGAPVLFSKLKEYCEESLV